jgi:hypothetical protein
VIESLTHYKGKMSRTIRNSFCLKRMHRTPRHKSAWVAKCDEYGIRPGAVPPTNYDDLPFSAWSELENRHGRVKKSERVETCDLFNL